MSDGRRYEFGPYRIHSIERLLYRGEELIPLPPKVAATLVVLIENAGQMVEKGDLMQSVWPDTIVEEGALTRNISLLRKTFGDEGDSGAYIETIPKRGYRFVAPVHLAAPAIDMPPAPGKVLSPWPLRGIALAGALGLLLLAFTGTWWLRSRKPVATRAGSPILTVVVLPLHTADAEGAEDYLAEGITQALITRLARIAGLRVISLASYGAASENTPALNEILTDKSVRFLLTGTLLQANGRLRVDVQLLDPRTRAVRWANSYQKDVRDILELEAAVTAAIAGEIQVTVSAAPTVTKVRPDALDAYLRGRYLWNRRTEQSLLRAIGYFQQAIDADSSFAAAYAGLADSYAMLGSTGIDGLPPATAMPRAKEAAKRALALDPQNADAHVSLAYVAFSYDWDLEAASREFQLALAVNPNSATGHHWYSHFFMASGDLVRARQEMTEAQRLEPLSPSINIGIGWCLYYSGRYDEAIEQYKAVTESDPTLPLAHQTLGMAYQQKKMYAEAIEEFRRAASFSGDSPASVAGLAGALAAAGKRDEANRELALLAAMAKRRYVPAFYFATVHYAMGDTATALRLGLKAIDERCDYLMYLGVEPQAGALKTNSVFLRAMARLRGGS